MVSKYLRIGKSRLFLVLALPLLLSAVALVPGLASPDTGSIEGTITYYGPISGDHNIGIAVFTNPDGSGSPEETLDIVGRSIDYVFNDAPPGTYYLTSHFDADDSGGPPDPGEPESWYDGDGDGQPDPVVVGGSAVTGIDISLGDIIYVNGDASGAGNGTSWADAYTEVSTALGAATAGSELWIAEGAYRPTSTSNRYATFQLKNGVGLYGGFSGTELLRSERDWQRFPTILTGDIGTDNVATDNSYNVVTGDGVDSTARIDGLVIADGYADGSGNQDKGGGLQISGGSPVVANVKFISNYAINHGAGMSTQLTGSTPLVINCTFSGNSTNWNGAMANLWYANTQVINTTFTGNTGANAGGIVNLEQGASTMRNVIFHGNGNEILLHNGGSIDIQYSIVAGASVYPGTGNSWARALQGTRTRIPIDW